MERLLHTRPTVGFQALWRQSAPVCPALLILDVHLLKGFFFSVREINHWLAVHANPSEERKGARHCSIHDVHPFWCSYSVYSIFLLRLFTGTICDHLRAEILTSGVSKTLLNHSIACWPPAVVLQCVQLQPFGGDKGDMRRHNSRSLSQRVVSCQFVV